MIPRYPIREAPRAPTNVTDQRRIISFHKHCEIGARQLVLEIKPTVFDRAAVRLRRWSGQESPDDYGRRQSQAQPTQDHGKNHRCRTNWPDKPRTASGS
jgi:hypothetical protein